MRPVAHKCGALRTSVLVALTRFTDVRGRWRTCRPSAPYCRSDLIPDEVSPELNGRRARDEAGTNTCDVVGAVARVAQFWAEDV